MGSERLGAPMIDAAVVGRRLRAARIMVGHDRVSDACREITKATGAPISERTLYAIERGEQLPTLEQLTAIVMTLDPPGGWAYLMPAYRPDVVEYLTKKRDETP